MSELVRASRNGDVAVIVIDNPPVNALSTATMQALGGAVEMAAADETVRAIVVTGAGRTFVAGADLRELEAVASGAGPAAGPDAHALLSAIEECPKPVVMAIHGIALGGGLELAMAGHYRVASADTSMGQPEVNLGLIPGAEGTQRLPRLVGVDAAIEMLVGGRPVTALHARQIGLLDEIASGDLLADAVAFARRAAAAGPPPKTRTRTDKLGTAEANRAAFAAGRAMAARTRRLQTAPLRALEALEAAASLPFDEGCRRERQIVAECLASEQCRALIHAFFAERAAVRIPDVRPDTVASDIGHVAVIGAGTMGSGIATALGNAGLAVMLADNDRNALERGVETIRQNFRRGVERGRMSEQIMQERLALIRPQLGYEGLAVADLVIEAVFEDLALKKNVFAQIDRMAKPGCVLATNTSTLDIDEIASATTRPESVIGLHFFSPANVMRLVEIVRGKATSHQILVTAAQVVKRLRKVGVVVGNCRGFVGNRMMFPYMREAQFLVEEGATPAQVDRALVEFGMAMGIFAVDDMGGLDLAWRVRQQHKMFDPPGARVPLVLEKLFDRKRLGQKSGAGWYSYEEGDRTPRPDPEVERLIEETARKAGIMRRMISESEIIARCMYAMINEAARILDEGHAARAADIDTIYITGYGFPAFRGGPLWYADTVGLDRILAAVTEFHRVHGAWWAPAPLLGTLVSRGQTFADFDRERG